MLYKYLFIFFILNTTYKFTITFIFPTWRIFFPASLMSCLPIKTKHSHIIHTFFVIFNHFVLFFCQHNYLSAGSESNRQIMDLQSTPLAIRAPAHFRGCKGLEPNLVVHYSALPIEIQPFVELTGLEPATSSVQGRRSPN